MDLSKEQLLIRSMILDHYENPTNKVDGVLDGYQQFNLNSPTCIDNLTALIKMENDKIIDAKFTGVGCAIATSSSDIMAEMIKGKTKKEANAIIDNYLNMVDGKDYDQEMLGEMFIFGNVNKQANRIKCAKVGIQALQGAINERK